MLDTTRCVWYPHLALFVTDERPAIQWLRHELAPDTSSGTQICPDLQPQCLRSLHQVRHEDLPEQRRSSRQKKTLS